MQDQWNARRESSIHMHPLNGHGPAIEDTGLHRTPVQQTSFATLS